jgi:hypothetical protein
LYIISFWAKKISMNIWGRVQKIHTHLIKKILYRKTINFNHILIKIYYNTHKNHYNVG